MILNEQDNKMISLMTFLYRNNNTWLKLTDLALFLDVTIKTLHSYLDKLQDMFSEYGKFYTTGSMIKVKLSPNFGLHTVQRTFLSQALVSRVISTTFFNPTIHKFDLAINLDVSESTIYRSIKTFNESLDGVYNLQFSYSKMAFEGLEREIQKFYINFFIETNPDPSNWIFEDYFKEDYANILAEKIKDYVKHKVHLPYFEYIKTSLAVSIIRLKQGHKVPIASYNEKAESALKDMCSNAEIASIIKREFPNSKEENYMILYNILAYFLSNDFFFFLFEPKDKIKEVLKQEAQHSFFLDKIKYLCDKYNLHIDDPDELYYQIHTYFKFKIANVDANDFFVNQSDYFLFYMKFFNVDFYNDMSTILEEYLDKYHPSLKYELKNLIYTVYNLWPELIHQLMVPLVPLNVLIISRYDYFYAKTIKSIIELTISFKMNIDIYEEEQIDYEKIKKSSYGLIISDFIIKEDLGDKLVFSFEQLPTVDRVLGLSKTLFSRYLNKMVEKNVNEFKDYDELLFQISKYKPLQNK